MIDLEKIKRYIVNGEVVHKGEFWRRGRKLSQRLEQIVIESKLNLRDIAFKYSAKIEEGTQCGPLYREHLADVIKGIRNTKRYVKAIEESWGLPIETIRSIYREDKETEKRMEKLDSNSIQEFAIWYKNILNSKKETYNIIKIANIEDQNVSEIAI
ncbi:hypothetical protein GS518_00835 [Leptospira interrogans]|uniref:Uncharacterized protein n=7 Tax=Leptospira interrogans TaxID=173 RepID=M6R3X2_LEPIR|nr:hypothetical protein [Leptospira interrogans]APH40173.1 Uncharacterized protein A9P81_0204 [Leptospira interrogans serovar Copenhageni/Icterohaemorrhagiae]EMO02817.1 hypothetical protein LEP1GSC116_0325 [Leptospira interrogans serovar Icterohaemorrhagiae str. Verdun HP]EMY05462.1 hypothetical protein LEP1GSC029_2336 [Leptospira interrogans str. 2002000626]EMY24952.1 hypothetical protein LEP1GSC115_5384 [Leptospira interrogans serovar Australis str. 200703203]AAS68795.1 conserved hypothetica